MPASAPVRRYVTGYMPARVRRLATAAVSASMWAALFLRGQRPNRKASLGAMADDLRWPTTPLISVPLELEVDDEQGARTATAVAVRYVAMARAEAAKAGVTAQKVSYLDAEAARSNLEERAPKSR